MDIEGVETKKENIRAKIVALAIILCIVIVADIGVWMLDALVIQKLWNWFIYPVTNFYFAYWGMFGALLIPTVLNTASTLRTEPSEDKSPVDVAAESVAKLIIHAIWTLTIWGIGAIIA